MGASSSVEQKVSAQQREVESLAASTGALPLLQKSFSKLADPRTNSLSVQSLEQCFFVSFGDPICEGPQVLDTFPVLMDHVALSVVELFFIPEKGGVNWVEFLRGYVKCCGRMSASMSLNALLRVFATTAKKAGQSLRLEFESDDADCKINGSLLPADVLLLLWMCWTLSWNSRKLPKEKATIYLPDVNNLVLSAIESCVEIGAGMDPWDSDISNLEVQLPAGKFLAWVLTTVPCLMDCFSQFVHARLQHLTVEDVSGPSQSFAGEVFPKESDLILNCGRTWAISLASKSTVSELILKSCFPGDAVETDENLLYRSCLHGKGLNRFWSKIEGYHGPLLIVVSATSEDPHMSDGKVHKWIIGALTQQGFENRDTFYGSSGSLFAISPIFHVFLPSGKEKNFLYTHLHPTARVYEPHPKPVGIAFGGTIGNERIFIDEDFSKVTVRHHAVDKTYQSGSLIPNQGFLPVEALISEVEVWGLGGRTAKELQTSYKKREELFTDQRRRVDLKTFGSWEDSPEKAMMDMTSDPNRVRREER